MLHGARAARAVRAVHDLPYGRRAALPVRDAALLHDGHRAARACTCRTRPATTSRSSTCRYIPMQRCYYVPEQHTRVIPYTTCRHGERAARADGAVPADAVRDRVHPPAGAVHDLPDGAGGLHAVRAADDLPPGGVLREVPGLPDGAVLRAGLRAGLPGLPDAASRRPSGTLGSPRS